MKKAKRILFTVLPILMLGVAIFVGLGSEVLADGFEISTELPNPGDAKIGSLTDLTNNVWGTVLSIAQILAFAAIIFAGVRYMFASADQKADIKKGLIYLVIGAILVFASSTIVKVIVNTTKEVAPTTSSIVSEIENV